MKSIRNILVIEGNEEDFTMIRNRASQSDDVESRNHLTQAKDVSTGKVH